MRKLFTLTLLLGLTVLASWAPAAEAVPTCSIWSCRYIVPIAPCACPPDSAHPGTVVTCGTRITCYDF